MKTVARCMVVVSLFFLLVTISGCYMGTLFSQNEYQSGTTNFNLPGSRPDIVNVIVNAGKSMGLTDISITDKNGSRSVGNSAGVIALPLPPGAIALVHFTTGEKFGETLGVIGNKTLTITASETNLDISYQVAGNYGNGSKETADKFIADFKENLSKQLQQQK